MISLLDNFAESPALTRDQVRAGLLEAAVIEMRAANNKLRAELDAALLQFTALRGFRPMPGTEIELPASESDLPKIRDLINEAFVAAEARIKLGFPTLALRANLYDAIVSGEWLEDDGPRPSTPVLSIPYGDATCYPSEGQLRAVGQYERLIFSDEKIPDGFRIVESGLLGSREAAIVAPIAPPRPKYERMRPE